MQSSAHISGTCSLPWPGGPGGSRPSEPGSWALAGELRPPRGGLSGGRWHPGISILLLLHGCLSARLMAKCPGIPEQGLRGAAGPKVVSTEDGPQALSPQLPRLDLPFPLLGTAASHSLCPRPAAFLINSPPAAQPPPACLLQRSPPPTTSPSAPHPTTCPLDLLSAHLLFAWCWFLQPLCMGLRPGGSIFPVTASVSVRIPLPWLPLCF